MSNRGLMTMSEYQALYDSCELRSVNILAVKNAGSRISQHWERYAAAVAGTAIPWKWLALVHLMEANLRFDCHLHNGDPLSARTVHHPAGRPTIGAPPFTWEDSAADVLRFQGLTGLRMWTIPDMLYQFERYNGVGYRRYAIYSPYLWAGSQHYSAGKFTSDGVFDPAAVSHQIGAGVILKFASLEGEHLAT